MATRPEVTMDPDHTYYAAGHTLPSVTTILEKTVADPPFNVAARYGVKVACDGVATLLDRGVLSSYPSGDGLLDALKRHRLMPDDLRNAAADTGTRIHKALEEYGLTGRVPQVGDYPEDEHPRVAGLCGWLLENRPEFLANEVRTVSLEHGYAGTFDGKVRFEAGKHKGRTALIDLKNTKRIYPKHFVQLEAYAQAEREWGEPEMDMRAVLHLDPGGKASLRKSSYEFEDFRVLLAVYQRNQERKRK